MRILHLLASPVFSGPAENVALLAAAQKELGHEVTVAVDRKRLRLADEEPAVPRLRALGILDGAGLELSVKSLPWRVAQDIRLLRNRPLDVVHSHFSHDHWIARFGLPKGARLIRSVHAERSLSRWMPRADAFTVPSERLRAQVPPVNEILPPLLADAFVPSGNKIQQRWALSVDGNPLVAMVSHFQPSRRHALGLAAFAQLVKEKPAAHLLLLGDGPLAPTLKAQANALGIESQVTFAGYQLAENFVKWLQCADEVWILGLGNDGSGRMARQARACGARVISVNEGGLADHAQGLVTTLTPDGVLSARASKDRLLETPFTNSQIAERMVQLYQRVGAGEERRKP